MIPEVDDTPAAERRAHWQRVAWIVAGWTSLGVGIVGIVLPLLPTVPFVLLAAFCFSRGSERLERWMLDHPRLGPPIAAWRRNRSVPLRAKLLATAMMGCSALFAWWLLPPPWQALPAITMAVVALWLWRLPTTAEPPRE